MVVFILVANSCTKDLNQEPHQIYYDNYYQTEDDALAAVNAAYDVLVRLTSTPAICGLFRMWVPTIAMHASR